jgi:N6-adenosine-specific RNA methylase IME4
MTCYPIVYADPPWSYSDKCHSGQRGAEYKYPCLTVPQIKALRVPDLAAPDALLYLWATPPTLPDALAVMAAWGFTYKTVAFTWVKTGKAPEYEPVVERMDAGGRLDDLIPLAWGMGHYTRANAELVLLGKRGNGVPVVDHGVHSVVLTPRMEHSRKPDEVRERIDRLHGPGPERVELFGRRPVAHWTVWGNDPAVVGFPGCAEVQNVLQGGGA